MDRSLLIRADAGIRMGTGHVMRCLGLAQAWQDQGGRAAYALAAGSPDIEERLRAENIEVRSLAVEPGSAEDARETAALAAALECDWIVLDGYHFDADYQHSLKQSGRRLLLLDDFGALPHYEADLVLNQDPIAEERLYGSREPGTRLLLGTEYTFLRREFRLRPRPRRDFPPVARKLLVTLGGSDPDNVTEKVIRSLDDVVIDGLEAVVLVGPSNPHWGVGSGKWEVESGKSAVASHFSLPTSHCRVRLLRNPPNIPELMAECDLAITAGGSTIWELAYCFVPSIVLLVAENQEPAMGLLHRRGACRRLGIGSLVSVEELATEISALCRDAAARAALGTSLGPRPTATARNGSVPPCNVRHQRTKHVSVCLGDRALGWCLQKLYA